MSYPPEFLKSLAGLGLAPTPSTPPALVRDALNDLYRYQLRALRDQLRAGLVPQSNYQNLVIDLRKRYWLLSLPLRSWEKICAGEE